jgi:predicted GNAT family acetyltransferase
MLRGQGIASRLMNDLRGKIRRKSGVPFLHVRSDAAATIRLYEKLGFAPRATFALQQLAAC